MNFDMNGNLQEATPGVFYLTNIFGSMNYPEIAETIMDELMASEIAFILDTLGILETFPHRSIYLNPLRDMHVDMSKILSLDKKEYTTIVLGKKLRNFVNKIKKPRVYWETKARRSGPTEMIIDSKPDLVWVACISVNFIAKMRWIMNGVRATPPRSGDMWGTIDRYVGSEVIIQPKEVVRYVLDRHFSPYDTGMRSSVRDVLLQPTFRDTDGRDDSIAVGHAKVNVDWSMELFRNHKSQRVRVQYMLPLVDPGAVHTPVDTEVDWPWAPGDMLDPDAQMPKKDTISLLYMIQNWEHMMVDDDATTNFERIMIATGVVPPSDVPRFTHRCVQLSIPTSN